MKEKLKKKKGIARLFEIAGERKGLLILAGILSAGKRYVHVGSLLVGIPRIAGVTASRQ